jgi:hypothetical protein
MAGIGWRSLFTPEPLTGRRAEILIGKGTATIRRSGRRFYFGRGIVATLKLLRTRTGPLSVF